MVIVYASRTKNVERFCSHIDKYKTVRVEDYDPSLGEFVLVTYTDKQGEIPKIVSNFLKQYHNQMVGVSASGRELWKLFGTHYKSAYLISELYDVPILHNFEMAGTDEDRKKLLERIEEIEQEKLHRT